MMRNYVERQQLTCCVYLLFIPINGACDTSPLRMPSTIAVRCVYVCVGVCVCVYVCTVYVCIHLNLLPVIMDV